ncbi:MAG TPA: hypothetical protein VFG88_13250 [Nocardioidaceae bacterium]|nr:hypothetical protein [Nocardioidaceae bacterium]
MTLLTPGLLGTSVLATSLLPAASAASRVDDYSGYEPQLGCTGTTKPGTAYLLRWLDRKYPAGTPIGTLRPCGSGGTSEHKDGRALDFGLDAADPADAAVADRLLARLFASDRHGNTDALARRMGIMYVIWDDHIYSAYSDGFSRRDYRPCDKPKNCSKTARHRDHVHISLSYAGAAAQTSFYRVRHVPAIPVLIPGTRQLDAQRTAITSVTVPADGTVVDAGFTLTRNTAYRIVADGLYRFGAGSKVADAACRWTRHGWAPFEAGLVVNGAAPWGADCASGAEHTYSTVIVPSRTKRLKLAIGDPHPRGNSGSLTFHVLRADLPTRSVATHYPAASRAPKPASHHGPKARRLRTERVDVRAAARRGVRTAHSLKRGARYRVIVRGLAHSGPTAFDGNCVGYAGRLHPQQSLDPTTPAADHLALYVAGVKVPLHARGSRAACDRRDHRYVGTMRAPVRGKARVQVWDPFNYADNSGSLQVTLRRR